MAKPHESCDQMGNDVFYENDGITNGADWYAVAGGMLSPISAHLSQRLVGELIVQDFS